MSTALVDSLSEVVRGLRGNPEPPGRVGPKTVLVFALAMAWFWVGAHAVRAEEPLLDHLPTGTVAEMAFRRALAEEAADPTAAIAAYRALLGAGFKPSDAPEAALGRLLPAAEAEVHWQRVLAADPPSPFRPEALAALAARREDQERWAEAADLWARFEKQVPDDDRRAEAAWRTMTARVRAGEGAAARKAAEHLWVDRAEHPLAVRAEAVLAGDGGDPYRPVTGERIFERGKNLLDRGRREAAIETLSVLLPRLRAGSPLLPRVDLALGTALYYQRRYEEALDPLRRAARKRKTGERARFLRARCLFGLNRGDEGAADLARLAREEPRSRRTPLYLYQATRVFEGRRLDRQARATRTRLYDRYGASDEARTMRWSEGWRQYRGGRWAEAAEAFLRSAKGAPPGWIRARGLYWEARALDEAGREPAATEVEHTLVAEHPLGYYALLTRRHAAGPLVTDPRIVRAGPVEAPPLRAGDLGPEGGRGVAYLRLGLPEAAARVFAAEGARGPRAARLRYWARDYHGALRAAGRSWLDWPEEGTVGPLDPEGLAFPLAYPATVTAAAREAGIHPHLLLAIAHTESHFDPRGYSPWEARGLLQFIPATARSVARQLGLDGFEPEDLFDPETALRLGARHLRDLLDRFDGDAVAAVAAYNGGAAAVTRWQTKRPGAPTEVFVESIPYRETRRYVKKVITALDAYARLDPPGLLPDLPPATGPTASPHR